MRKLLLTGGASGCKHLLRRLGRAAGVPRVHAHRFRHTCATGAIAHDARELDVQHLLGHRSPEMVRRSSATYGSAQAAERRATLSQREEPISPYGLRIAPVPVRVRV